MHVHLYDCSKGNSSTQPMVQWSEVYGHPGLIFCITQSTNNPLALYVTPDQITIQELKATPPAAASNGSSKTNGSSNSKSTKVLDYEVVRSLNSSNKVCVAWNMYTFRGFKYFDITVQ